jgi:hypothetical protein
MNRDAQDMQDDLFLILRILFIPVSSFLRIGGDSRAAI